MPATTNSSESQQSTSSQANPSDRIRDIVAGCIDAVSVQAERALDVIGLRTGSKHWIPDVDVYETPNQVRVLVNLPGVDPQKVDLTLTGNMLSVAGEIPAANAEKGETIHRHERPSGNFTRSIPLPVSVDPEKVSAESRHGVLTIVLAKEERIKPRQIHVESPPPSPRD
jgi:HSP20 family protein